MRIVLLAALTLAAAPALALADPPHATGGWVELGLDSEIVATGEDGLPALDAPLPHLVVGAQLDRLAVGVETGFLHVAGDNVSLLTIGPTARFAVAARGSTELVLDGSLLATIGLAPSSGENGGPTTYTLAVGVEVRHWIDPHFAVGGGVLGQLATASQGIASDLGLQLAGTFRVTGVF